MDETKLENQAELTSGAASQAPSARKNSKLAPILAIVLIVLAAGGFFVYQSLPSTKAGKLVKEALAQMESKDYVKAVETLVSARDIAPESGKVTDAFFKVFDANVNDVLSKNSSDIVHALEVYRQAEELLPDQKDAVLQKEAEIYRSCAAEISKGDYLDLIYSLISDLDEAVQRGVPGLETTRADLTKQAASLETKNALYHFALEYITAFNNGDSQALIDIYLRTVGDESSDFFQKVLANHGTRAASFPILSEYEGKKTGIYYKNGQYFVYCGEYDKDNKRSGTGSWISTKGDPDHGSYKIYRYGGDWANDKPNGSMWCYVFTRTSGGNEEIKICTAPVKDGLFNGTFTITYDWVDEFEVSYINGDPVQIDTFTGSDGIPAKVYSYNEDRTKQLLNLSMHDGVFGTY